MVFVYISTRKRDVRKSLTDGRLLETRKVEIIYGEEVEERYLLFT